MLQRELEVEREKLSFVHDKKNMLSFFREDPISISELRNKENLSYEKAQKYLNKFLIIVLMFEVLLYLVSFKANSVVMSISINILAAAFAAMFAGGLFSKYMWLVQIRRDYETTVDAESHERCKALAQYMGIDEINQYIKKVDISGRRLSHQEYKQIILVWQEVNKRKEDVNFLV